MADLARLAAGTIFLPEAAPAAVGFAAEELRRYLGRLFGATPRRVSLGRPAGSWLHLVGTGARAPEQLAPVASGAEWTVAASAEAVTLAGTTPRACLAAAYAVLAEAGCTWSPAGVGEERLPVPGAAARAVASRSRRARFVRRVYASDLATWHYTVPERLAERLPADAAFVDWMAKTDATGLFFIRAANDTQWIVPELLPDLERRGLAVEGGGHALAELLPRALFTEQPEYFPMTAGGQRSDCGNVCVASAAARALVAERARAARAAIPGEAGFHLWGLDLFGGGWCACGACAALTPSEQALVVANDTAEALGGGAVFHLAYHDTLSVPRAVAPHPRVWAEFAPRERCYGHPLDDPGCTTNRRYRRALEDHMAAFDGRVEVFEYYADAILFGGCAVPLVDVIARDLAYYRAVGARGISCLLFGQYSCWAYGVNLAAFATEACDPGATPRARERHCRAQYGRAAPVMARYLAALEALMARVVTYGDVKLPPRDLERGGEVLVAVEEALAEVGHLDALLAEAAGKVSVRIGADAVLFAYTAATLAAVRAWLAARLGRLGDPGEVERADAAVEAAIARVRSVPYEIAGAWGLYDLELTHAVFRQMRGVGD